MSATISTIVTPVTSAQVDNFISQFALTAHISYILPDRKTVRQDLTIEALSAKTLDSLPVGASVHIVIPTWKGVGKKLWTKAEYSWLEHPLSRDFKGEVNIIRT